MCAHTHSGYFGTDLAFKNDKFLFNDFTVVFLGGGFPETY